MADAVKAADPVKTILAKQPFTVKAQGDGKSTTLYRLRVDGKTVQDITVDKRDEKGNVSFDPTAFDTPGDHTLSVAAVNEFSEAPGVMKFNVLDPAKTDPNPVPNVPTFTVEIKIQIGTVVTAEVK